MMEHISQVCRKIKRTEKNWKMFSEEVPPYPVLWNCALQGRKEVNDQDETRSKTENPRQPNLLSEHSRGLQKKRGGAASWKDDSGHVMEKMWPLSRRHRLLVDGLQSHNRTYCWMLCLLNPNVFGAQLASRCCSRWPCDPVREQSNERWTDGCCCCVQWTEWRLLLYYILLYNITYL